MNQNNHKLNVLLLQYNPIHKDVESNIKNINKLLSKYNESHNIDLVVLPEMALTGYVFNDLDDIKALCEEYNNGITYKFVSELAKRFKSYVFCGFPEKCKASEKEHEIEKYYNAAMIVDREGNALKSYRKTFLYELDKTWCEEGDGFRILNITTKSGKEVILGIGICMDINPWEFKSAYDKREFSTFCFKNNVDAIVFLTNWTEPAEDNETYDYMSTLNYWVDRCSPLIKSEKQVYFLAANRIGNEKSTYFTGGSCIIQLNNAPILHQALAKKEEGTIYKSLDI